MKKIVFVVEKTSTGYAAYAQDFEKWPVGTTGNTMKELRRNICEAINTYRVYKGLKPLTETDITVTLDIPQFFEYYRVINAKALAERIGMSQSLLSQYANGIKTPSGKQTHKILAGIKELGRELTQLEFV